MSKKNILLIVEGAKTDVRLMNNLMETYNLLDYEIVSYNTNIYTLYNQMFTDGSSYGRDLLQTLIENKNTQKDVEILKRKYTHIILCFDLDPHDEQYSKEKIQNMSEFFYESTDNGKLYINYPMIESFSHRNGVNDNDYLTREISHKDIKDYKRIVNEFTPDPSKLIGKKSDVNQIIIQNLIKANYILYGNDNINYHVDLHKLLKYQCDKYDTTRSLFVLCTCIFFIADYNKNLILT